MMAMNKLRSQGLKKCAAVARIDAMAFRCGVCQPPFLQDSASFAGRELHIPDS
jgi:hypothetical protein